MSIITFGRIDKKLIIVLILIILRTIELIVDNEVDGDYSNSYINSLANEIAPILAGVVLLFTFKQKQKDEDKSKKSFKYIFYFFILRAIKCCYEKMYSYFIKGKKYKFNNIINTINGVEIILITFGTLFMLKYV